MRAIPNRVLAALGTANLVANGLVGCDGPSTVGTVLDTTADAVANGMIAVDGTVPGAANGDAYPEARVDVFGIIDGSSVTDGVGTDDVGNTGDRTNPSDGAAFAETAVEPGTDGAVSCTCSMLNEQCGDANPCGCCAVTGLLCSARTGEGVCIILTP